MPDLYHHSVEVILAHQAPGGGYLASSTFPDYRYCWFRDGAYTAYAMDLAGEHESAHRFHDWCARVVNQRRAVVERAIEKANRGELLAEVDYLHTRYTLDGHEGDDATWPNFQLDGLGAWLWALAEHAHLAGMQTLPPAWQEAATLTARYLAALWSHPCYDCWEEFGDRVHPYTLAAIYGGLNAAAEPSAVTENIRRFVLEHGVQNGRLAKHIQPRQGDATPDLDRIAAIDANLIGVATPYRLLAPTDPLMQATVARIEADLHRPSGGVHRYLADTYYGGGEWVLLAAWLGWYYTEVGEWKRARELLRWVEAQADADGHLPEQVSTHLLAPDRYAEWEARWGPVARPLLWSHAMYLILYQALELAGQR